MRIFEHVSTITPQCHSWETTNFCPYGWEDVAYALAFLSPIQRSLVDIKYALYFRLLPELGRYFFAHSIDHLKHKGMLGKPGTNRKVANIAILNGLSEFKHKEDRNTWVKAISELSLNYNINRHICSLCGGRKSIVISAETLDIITDVIRDHVNAGGVVVCPGCAGIGERPPSILQRARIMGVPETTWRRDFEPIFRELVDELGRIELSASGIMKSRIR